MKLNTHMYQWRKDLQYNTRDQHRDHEIKVIKCTCGKLKMSTCHFIHGCLSNGLPNSKNLHYKNVKISLYGSLQCESPQLTQCWESVTSGVGNWVVNPPFLTNKEGSTNLKYEKFPKCDVIACNGLIKLWSSFVLH